jgi:hypothetical protein
MLPIHFTKVLEPFVCDPSPTGRGPKRLSTSHDIPCDLNDDTYRAMYYIAIAGMTVVLTLFGLIYVAIDYSWSWQYGNRVRESIPITVAVVEVSVAGMKGYISSVRDTMQVKVIATRAFVIEPDLMQRRETISQMEYEEAQD